MASSFLGRFGFADGAGWGGDGLGGGWVGTSSSLSMSLPYSSIPSIVVVE